MEICTTHAFILMFHNGASPSQRVGAVCGIFGEMHIFYARQGKQINGKGTHTHTCKYAKVVLYNSNTNNNAITMCFSGAALREIPRNNCRKQKSVNKSVHNNRTSCQGYYCCIYNICVQLAYERLLLLLLLLNGKARSSRQTK